MLSTCSRIVGCCRKVLYLTKSLYNYISEQWKKPYEGEHGGLMKQRLMEWRRQPSIV
ncbi:MAG: hypothetical protein RMI45_06395, partial [Ignisphaera sp.]|nr:hypothetical protein [Ignisphaera sp.]MDW8085853.1 hypothetical protein [Ignisphaera sp.]